jgi:hypothetical protein
LLVVAAVVVLPSRFGDSAIGASFSHLKEHQGATPRRLAMLVV